jgi:hypothetical protein
MLKISRHYRLDADLWREQIEINKKQTEALAAHLSALKNYPKFEDIRRAS